MKFVKWKKQEDKDSASIVWSNSLNAYKVSSGVAIGELYLKDDEELAELKSKGIPTDIRAELKLAGFDPDKVNYSNWNHAGDTLVLNGTYTMRLDKDESKNELPFGVFEMRMSNHGDVCFKPYKKTEEKLMLIKNKNLGVTVKDFYNSTERHGRKNKTAILLYGPPGNGKTTEIMQLFDICEELKLRIFIINSKFHIESMNEVKNLLQQENCMFVLEEMTERLQRNGVEEILTFLDGENSWNNSITIATTNYPEDLPSNLVDRPGRFETFIEYNNPTEAEVVELGAAFGFSELESKCLVGQGLSFDYVSFIFSQAKKLNKPVKEAREFEEAKRRRLSATFKGKMGI